MEPSRRILAAVIDAVAIAAFSLVGSVLTFIVYVMVTGNDFDGPSEYDTLSDWFALGLLSFFALTYGLAEPLLFTSIGKAVLGLRIASAPQTPLTRARVLLRWAVKFLPVIAFCAVAWTNYEVLKRNLPWNVAVYDPDRFRWLDALLSECALVVTVVTIVAHLGWFLLSGRRTLHDHVARTRLARRSVATTFATSARGFEVIVTPLAAEARPAHARGE